MQDAQDEAQAVDGATRARVLRPDVGSIVNGTGCKFGLPASASAAVSGTNVVCAEWYKSSLGLGLPNCGLGL